MVKKSGLEKCKKKMNAHGGFTPAVLCFPQIQYPLNRSSLLIAISAGAVGGQVLSPPSLYQYFVCPSIVTGILPGQKIRS